MSSVLEKIRGLAPKTTEQKLAALLLVATLAYGFRSAEEVKALRKKEAEEVSVTGKAQRRPSAERWQDHPVGSWFVTNASVLTAVLLKTRLVGDLKQSDSFALTFFKMMATNVVMVDSCVVWHQFLINKLYAHVPFFSDKRLPRTAGDAITDYLRCNLVANSIMGMIQVHAFRRKPAEAVLAKEGPWRPLRFLMRLVWMRVWVDVVFWLGHKVLHMKYVYQYNHRTHHEHSATQITTNYHFDWWDLIIEASIPFLVGGGLYEGLVGPIDQFDQALIATYVFWHEMASHAGKPLPTMPLLGPLSTWTQKYDDFNVWFHEVHHRTLKSNFSITPWFDQLMGTDRWTL